MNETIVRKASNVGWRDVMNIQDAEHLYQNIDDHSIFFTTQKLNHLDIRNTENGIGWKNNTPPEIENFWIEPTHSLSKRVNVSSNTIYVYAGMYTAIHFPTMLSAFRSDYIGNEEKWKYFAAQSIEPYICTYHIGDKSDWSDNRAALYNAYSPLCLSRSGSCMESRCQCLRVSHNGCVAGIPRKGKRSWGDWNVFMFSFPLYTYPDDGLPNTSEQEDSYGDFHISQMVRSSDTIPGTIGTDYHRFRWESDVGDLVWVGQIASLFSMTFGALKDNYPNIGQILPDSFVRTSLENYVWHEQDLKIQYKIHPYMKDRFPDKNLKGILYIAKLPKTNTDSYDDLNTFDYNYFKPYIVHEDVITNKNKAYDLICDGPIFIYQCTPSISIQSEEKRNKLLPPNWQEMING